MSHSSHDLFENRKQFQLERMILFSDAVFAIAITLMVIEIRIPDLHGAAVTENAMRSAMAGKFAEFFGFILSFAVIGLFWVQHHRLFGLVEDYDNKLLWLNLHMLFWIVLVPFSSGLNSHYGNLDYVWELYSFNMFMIGMAIYFLWKYIGNPSRKLSMLASDPVRRKYALIRSLSVAFIFLMGALLCFFNWEPTSYIARFIYFLIFPLMLVINRLYKKNSDKKSPA